MMQFKCLLNSEDVREENENILYENEAIRQENKKQQERLNAVEERMSRMEKTGKTVATVGFIAGVAYTGKKIFDKHNKKKQFVEDISQPSHMEYKTTGTPYENEPDIDVDEDFTL